MQQFLQDYMKEGALRLRLTLSERDKLKLDDIDFSRLSDGHYMINNDYFIVNNGMYTIVEDEDDFENFLLREFSKQFYLEDFYKIEKGQCMYEARRNGVYAARSAPA